MTVKLDSTTSSAQRPRSVAWQLQRTSALKFWTRKMIKSPRRHPNQILSWSSPHTAETIQLCWKMEMAVFWRELHPVSLYHHVPSRMQSIARPLARRRTSLSAPYPHRSPLLRSQIALLSHLTSEKGKSIEFSPSQYFLRTRQGRPSKMLSKETKVQQISWKWRTLE